MRDRVVLLLLYPLVLLALAVAAVRYPLAIVTAPHKSWDLAREADEAANVAINGKPGTTISARAGRAMLAGRPWGCVLCGVLDWLSPRHCEREVVKERLFVRG